MMIDFSQQGKLEICNFGVSEDERRILIQFVRTLIYLRDNLIGSSFDSALEFKTEDGDFAITPEDLLAAINTIKLLVSDVSGEFIPMPPKRAQ